MAKLLGKVEWYRGDSYPVELTIKNATTKAVIDLTGFSFVLTVDTLKAPPDDTAKAFEITGVIDDPTTGIVSFTPTVIQTDVPPKTYYYDIQMTDASGNIRTIAKNQFVILQDITKS